MSSLDFWVSRNKRFNGGCLLHTYLRMSIRIRLCCRPCRFPSFYSLSSSSSSSSLSSSSSSWILSRFYLAPSLPRRPRLSLLHLNQSHSPNSSRLARSPVDETSHTAAVFPQSTHSCILHNSTCHEKHEKTTPSFLHCYPQTHTRAHSFLHALQKLSQQLAYLNPAREKQPCLAPPMALYCITTLRHTTPRHAMHSLKRMDWGLGSLSNATHTRPDRA